VTDALRLLWTDAPPDDAALERMDLFNVADIKRLKGGGLELKFFDRAKALEQLARMTPAENQETAAFFAALGGAAQLAEEA
jgi:hypothetical protein